MSRTAACDVLVAVCGKDAHHLKHRPAGGRGGIKALLMQEQIDAFGMKVSEEAEQIDERSA
jgi:hypothetical protein